MTATARFAMMLLVFMAISLLLTGAPAIVFKKSIMFGAAKASSAANKEIRFSPVKNALNAEYFGVTATAVAIVVTMSDTMSTSVLLSAGRPSLLVKKPLICGAAKSSSAANEAMKELPKTAPLRPPNVGILDAASAIPPMA